MDRIEVNLQMRITKIDHFATCGKPIAASSLQMIGVIKIGEYGKRRILEGNN